MGRGGSCEMGLGMCGTPSRIGGDVHSVGTPETCQIPGLVNFSFMSNILGLPPLVALLQSSFWTGSVEMGMGMSSEN